MEIYRWNAMDINSDEGIMEECTGKTIINGLDGYIVVM